MTPVDLANRYDQLRQRLAMHVPGACRDVSVPLPTNLDDELAFYRLVNWAYIVLNEAARMPMAFLMALPPLKANADLRIEVSKMRTFVAHNLDAANKSDLKTRSFAHSWFRSACGIGSPMDAAQFARCSEYLGERVELALRGAVEACDALDDPTDGPALVNDLRGRIDLNWEAHRFDPIVAEVANVLGNPGLDLIEIRRRNLEAWRRTLSAADEGRRHEALRLKIEATLVSEIADTLPISAAVVSKTLAITGPNAVCAALVILRDVRRFAPTTGVGQIIEAAGGQVLNSMTRDGSELSDHLMIHKGKD
jgi:hypothetical protein